MYEELGRAVVVALEHSEVSDLVAAVIPGEHQHRIVRVDQVLEVRVPVRKVGVRRAALGPEVHGCRQSEASLPKADEVGVEHGLAQGAEARGTHEIARICALPGAPVLGVHHVRNIVLRLHVRLVVVKEHLHRCRPAVVGGDLVVVRHHEGLGGR